MEDRGNISKAVLIIVCAYSVDTLYTLVEWDFTSRHSFFPFFHGYDGWDGKMALGSYVYYFCQHVYIMMLLHAFYLVSGWRFINALFWLEFADLIDYIACYHEAWFVIDLGPASVIGSNFIFEFQYVKIILICLFAWRYWPRPSS
jgi:hypothetical protein